MIRITMKTDKGYVRTLRQNELAKARLVVVKDSHGAIQRDSNGQQMTELHYHMALKEAKYA